jgi:MFS transporter, ACDE family, multidrug resistance protein
VTASTHQTSGSSTSIFHQTKAVWAVAFASVIAFMGIGLVDPILPAISSELGASPSQTLLLFTSYLIITGLAMFFTSFVSSRIGAKRTLLIGLVLIVAFAAAAGASDSVGMIIGFRAGWGLGNALFISTALATIVGAASGGVDSAIILYESALGVGIAIGPLLGGLLGTISWRGPFFGTAVLMAVGLIAIMILLGKTETKPDRISLTAPLTAIRHKAILTLGLIALFYNFGFFVLLAYSPFPLAAAAKAAGMGEFGAIQLGLVFFGWGLCLALTSVFVAQRMANRLGRRVTIYIALACLMLVELIMAIGIDDFTLITVGVIVGGLFLGIMNTVMTEAVMEASDLPRSVASSTYSGIRFLGGAIAPAVAGPISAHIGAGAPYYFGAAAFAAGMIVLTIGRRTIAHIDADETLDEQLEAELLTVADS